MVKHRSPKPQLGVRVSLPLFRNNCSKVSEMIIKCHFWDFFFLSKCFKILKILHKYYEIYLQVENNVIEFNKT